MKKSKKILLILFLVFVLGGCGCPIFNYSVQAESNVYNPEYIEYLKLSEEEKKNYDVIPSKYIIPYKKATKYNETSIGTSITRAVMSLRNAGLADSFDLSEKININVEDQGEYGVCWAFASLGALRTHLALKGIEVDPEVPQNTTPDLSEWHLNILTSKYYDKFGSERDPVAHNKDIAGNFDTALEYFKCADGPVLEETLRYETQIDFSNQQRLNELDNYKPVAYVNNVVQFPTFLKTVENEKVTVYNPISETEYNVFEDETELINYRNNLKQQIMENGGVYAHIRTSETNFMHESTDGR